MFLYYIVRTIKMYIRKYMGTLTEKYPIFIGFLHSLIFLKIQKISVYFKTMSTLIFIYGYNFNLYYLPL